MKYVRSVFASIVSAFVVLAIVAPGPARALDESDSRDAVVVEGSIDESEMHLGEVADAGTTPAQGVTSTRGGTTTQEAMPAQGVTAARSEATASQGTAQGAAAEVETQQTGPQQMTSQQAVEVYDADGLLAMAGDPYGTYRLTADVDMTGVPWQPFEFYGTLDGGGHAILNASVTSSAAARRTTYDGNMISYDTIFSGFFGTLEGATVRDVQLLGLNVDVRTSEPTFVGGICGYMDAATIDGCTVQGQVSLATTGESFGVGGIAGFGCGSISNCVADTTLVCRDLDAVNKDEQFLGGAYANGYADLVGNDITLAGYDSDHGYVHDGGMVGMYIVYPEGTEHSGTIAHNTVRGSITFFEDNLDRRAYCEPEIGENMSMWAIEVREGNTSDFLPDERFEYDQDLLPHNCDNPQWTEEVVAATSTEHGYTRRTCTTCGYTERVAWTPLAREGTEPSEAAESDAQEWNGEEELPEECTEGPNGEGQSDAGQTSGIPWPVAVGVSVVALGAVAALAVVWRRRG